MNLLVPDDVQSSITRNEAETLARLARDTTVLELGAWLGHSTICMAQTAQRVYSVDWHQGDPHAGEASTLSGYFANLGRYGVRDQVVPIVGRFEDVLPILDKGVFGLIFLDGFHTYEQVKRDLVQIQRIRTPDTTLVFHDYGVEASSRGGAVFGVTQALQETLGQPARVVDTLAIYDR
jgi:predicted O-methyltransferase YrrM